MGLLDNVLNAVIGLIPKKGITLSWTFKTAWTGDNVSKWKHFQDSEVEGLQDDFVAKLDNAREIANTPFRITSGRRTFLENQQIPGAVNDSSHLEGLAVDLYCFLSEERFKIVKALMDTGFVRIGVYKKHIHVDDSKTLPQDVFWYIDGD